MNKQHRLRNNILLAMTSSLFVFVLLFLSGEWMVRYRERHRSTVPGDMASIFYQQFRLGHAMVRQLDYYGWVHVNEHGFRGASVGLDKPDDALRVMAVGGSTTFDRGVTADDRTWPARLEHWLNAAGPPKPLEVINAGVPGYKIADNTIRLLTELYRFRPDAVILYHAHNDLFSALRLGPAGAGPALGKRPGQIPVATPWGRWLNEHSLLVVKLKSRWQAIRGRRGGGGGGQRDTAPPPPAGPPMWALEQFERDLSSFVAVAKNLGTRVILVNVVQVSGPVVTEADPVKRASWANAVPFAPVEAVLTGYAQYNDIIRRVADTLATEYVDTDDFGLEDTAFYEADDPIHFNDSGADRMAQHMARVLLERNLLFAQPPSHHASN